MLCSLDLNPLGTCLKHLLTYSEPPPLWAHNDLSYRRAPEPQQTTNLLRCQLSVPQPLHCCLCPSLTALSRRPARLQEIGGALETALATGAAGPAVWTALQRCWSAGVHLRPLTHRFWQLSLQIVSRYGTWLTSRLDAEVGVAADRAGRILLLGLM